MEKTPWQYFVAIPDLKSTGIKDGKRYMGWAAIIRAINTVDAVTAQSVEIPFDMLCRMRDRIIAEVPGVNRVLWDISDKPVSTNTRSSVADPEDRTSGFFSSDLLRFPRNDHERGEENPHACSNSFCPLSAIPLISAGHLKFPPNVYLIFQRRFSEVR